MPSTSLRPRVENDTTIARRAAEPPAHSSRKVARFRSRGDLGRCRKVFEPKRLRSSTAVVIYVPALLLLLLPLFPT
eukprot:5195517-Pyramimonas_sp.AAC.1